MNAAPEVHPVLALIAERLAAGGGPGAGGDGHRLSLAIEGGGMRGTITAGMALGVHELGVHELGLTPVFGHVYGSPAGAITGAWLCSANPPGLRMVGGTFIWTPSHDQRPCSFSTALLRGCDTCRPGAAVQVEHLERSEDDRLDRRRSFDEATTVTECS